MNKKITSLFFQSINCLILLTILFFSYACRYIPDTSLNQSVMVGFCSDIIGLQEPVFTKPFLNTLRDLEKQKKIRLQIQTSQFASAYPDALATLASTNQVVFCGPLFSKVIIQVAEQFPDTYFVLMQAIPAAFTAEKKILPNLQWILFPREESAYLMGKISSLFPASKACWLVTDLPSNHPMRVYEEAAFIKGLQPASVLHGVLEWPLVKQNMETENTDRSHQDKVVYCLTEGAYIPSFTEWFATLPEQDYYLVLPDDSWNNEIAIPVLGTVSKYYNLSLETVLQQIRSNSWQAGLQDMPSRQSGFKVFLNERYWESSLKAEIESNLTSVLLPES